MTMLRLWFDQHGQDYALRKAKGDTEYAEALCKYAGDFIID
jgi:hypothetical protein